MNARDRNRTGFAKPIVAVLSMAALVTGASLVEAQAPQGRTRTKTQATARKGAQAARPRTAAPAADVPKMVIQRHLVNPNDPIAIVNGEPITRQQLADECVARRGQEILETMIARLIVDQAVRAKGLEVKPVEIDAEIDRIAGTVGVTREKWLASLNRERGISPAQYARDIIEPSLALKKLSEPLVQVTEQDMKDAFETQYGEQLVCRMIMLPTMDKAKQVWEQVKANPESFEKLAQEESIDQSTRAVGGMLPMPLTRHASPVADRAFAELVDGEPGLGEKYKPKDGDISPAFQVSDVSWVIFKREALKPARPYDEKDDLLRERIKDYVYQAKVQEKISEVVENLMRQAAIENKLTGEVKTAESEQPPVDGEVQLMSNPGAAIPQAPEGQKGAVPATTSKPGAAPDVPAGVSAEDIKKINALKGKKD